MIFLAVKMFRSHAKSTLYWWRCDDNSRSFTYILWEVLTNVRKIPKEGMGAFIIRLLYVWFGDSSGGNVQLHAMCGRTFCNAGCASDDLMTANVLKEYSKTLVFSEDISELSTIFIISSSVLRRLCICNLTWRLWLLNDYCYYFWR